MCVKPNHYYHKVARRIFCLLAVIMAVCMGNDVRADVTRDIIYTDTFPTVTCSGWTGTFSTELRNSDYALKFVNTAATAKYAVKELDATKFSGRSVIITALVKGDSLSSKPQWYNGAKLMLTYHTTSGTTSNPQATIDVGTFDWKTYTLRVALPQNVDSVKLTLGLESVTGTVWFDDVCIQAEPAVFSENFNVTSTLSQRWAGTIQTDTHSGAGMALKVYNAAATLNTVSASLPMVSVAGRRLLVTAQVKGSAVSAKTGTTSGVVLRVTYTNADSSVSSSQAVIPVGTFDWMRTSLVVTLPVDVVSASLSLGLDSVSGTAWFDNVKIEANPVIMAENMEDATLFPQQWSASGYTFEARGTGHSLKLTNTSSSQVKSAWLTLPSQCLAGKRIVIRGEVKADNLSAKPNSWNGIKMLFYYKRANDTTVYNPQITLGVGTFGWTKVSMVVSVPSDVVLTKLQLGLELVSGSVNFDNVSIDLIDVDWTDWTNPTPNFRGHTENRLRGMMINTNMTDADIDEVKAWKANLVRWQLGMTSYSGLAMSNYDSVLSTELTKLNARLPKLTSSGIKAVLDLHSLSFGLFNTPENQRKLQDVWKNLATLYKDNTTIWAFDIANEPLELTAWNETMMTWNELSEQVALTIRDVTATKPIIIESSNIAAASAMSYLKPARTSNVIYSFHWYEPSPYTHQFVLSQFTTAFTYPGTINGVYWDSNTMLQVMAPVIAFQNKYQVAIYVGEFSSVRWAPGACQYLNDAASIFESKGWDWSYHAFREWEGWSVEYGSVRGDLTPPVTDTDRELLLKNFFLLN